MSILSQKAMLTRTLFAQALKRRSSRRQNLVLTVAFPSFLGASHCLQRSVSRAHLIIRPARLTRRSRSMHWKYITTKRLGILQSTERALLNKECRDRTEIRRVKATLSTSYNNYYQDGSLSSIHGTRRHPRPARNHGSTKQRRLLVKKLLQLLSIDPTRNAPSTTCA